MRALDEMAHNPFAGDVRRLRHELSAFRRRLGNWRILFDILPHARLVDVHDIERRTSKSYHKR